MNPRSPLPILAALGRNIRTNRNALGLSQMGLADESGLHRTYIADLERGARNPSLISMARIALAMKMTVSDLCREVDARFSLEEPGPSTADGPSRRDVGL
jgi:transcriptional regulator with XRE-family HTH domain